ncbi:hypothetical protein [Streptomyces sp. NPDC054975]
MKKSARIATATIVAALAIGVAAPAASAAQTATPVAAVATYTPTGSVAPAGALGGNAAAPAAASADVAAVQRAAAGSSKGKAFLELLKRTGGLFKKAATKAKEGQQAFNRWMGDQHWSVRAAWWALGAGTQAWVWEQLLNWVG